MYFKLLYSCTINHNGYCFRKIQSTKFNASKMFRFKYSLRMEHMLSKYAKLCLPICILCIHCAEKYIS